MEEEKRRRAKKPPVRVLRVVGTSKKSVFEAIDNAVESVGVHGEKVHAVVQPIDWNEAGDELAHELAAFCREHLAHYKCPKAFDFDPELPRQATGKLYKRLIRDRYWGNSNSRIV